MKRTLGTILLLAVAFCSVQAASTPKIEKVTYFPLSYVAYHDIQATNMDIGTGRVSATGTFGSAGVTEPLKVQKAGDVGDTTLYPDAIFRLNGSSSASTSIKVKAGETAIIGYGTASGGSNHQLEFKQDLRLGTTSSFSNLNTTHATVSSMNLFGKSFPDCTADRDEDGNNMYWVKLKLDATDKCLWYLSCGAVAEDKQCTQDGTSGNLEPDGSPKTCATWKLLRKMCNVGYSYDTSKDATVVEEDNFATTCCKPKEKVWHLTNKNVQGNLRDVQCESPCYTNSFYIDVGFSEAPDDLAEDYWPSQCNPDSDAYCVLQINKNSFSYCYRYTCQYRN